MSKWRISNYLCSMVCVLQSLCLSGTTCEPFFLSFSGCLSLPPSFWFILSPFNAPPLLFLCDQNRQHQFYQPTTVALASANWTNALWDSPLAIGCLCWKGTRVAHGGCFVLRILSKCDTSLMMSNTSGYYWDFNSVPTHFLISATEYKLGYFLLKLCISKYIICSKWYLLWYYKSLIKPIEKKRQEKTYLQLQKMAFFKC